VAWQSQFHGGAGFGARRFQAPGASQKAVNKPMSATTSSGVRLASGCAVPWATAALSSGAVLVALLLAAAALSLVWTPWSPYEMEMAAKLQPPAPQHWLGTDAFGRDVASLLLVGARNSMLVGVIAVGIGLGLGTALGLLAAARAAGWKKPSCGWPTSRLRSRPSCRPS
jgi:ABC-type dipeptide/oligopeptide/nickel transport system permease subunit